MVAWENLLPFLVPLPVHFLDANDALHRQVQAARVCEFVAQALLGRVDHQALVDVEDQVADVGETPQCAGGDVAVALIGPGVDASHNYERTHLEALVATTQWVVAYLLS